MNEISQKALNNFLATFNEQQDGGAQGQENVMREIANFWQKKGTLGTPAEIFNHLMDKRVESGVVSQKRAEILQDVFNDSFAPEHSTGYLAKHREPLVDALAHIYVERIKPQTPVWRIEGDISNLGGLNKAMIASAKQLESADRKAYEAMLRENGLRDDDNQAIYKLGHTMADKVLHTICQITLKHLQKKADVIPVRKGGDEISFVAVMRKGISGDEIKDTLKQTQADIAQFVASAGLIIPHGKYPGNRRRSGVGIGLHEVDMTLHDPQTQQQMIAQGIPTSKESYQDLLHRNEPMEIDVPDMKMLNALLKPFPAPPVLSYVPRLGNTETSPVRNDEHRLIKLFATLKSSGNGALLPAEEKAAVGVHALVRKNDFVTGLPLFEDMQDNQLPSFFMRFADKKKDDGIKLVNVDFSNVAGGNELSEALGNAMLRSFRDTLLTAMHKSGLSEYADGIAVRPGGKFALLVPSGVFDKTKADFALQLKESLDTASRQPLGLSTAEQEDIHKNIAAKEKLQAYYGAKGKKLQDDNGNLHITIADIVHPKSRLQGSNVVMTFSKYPVALDVSLGDQLKPLEVEAAERQNMANDYRVSSSFTSRLGSDISSGITR